MGNSRAEESMEKIITWLMNIERLAGEVYKQTANYFKDDPTLREFLEHLARDEETHYHIMAEASECIKNILAPVPPVAVDEEINKTIEVMFREISEKIATQTLTKDYLYNYIVAAEQSEFNDIFLYVVNTLKGSSRKFIPAATVIQNHLRFIQYYFQNTLKEKELTAKLKRLPRVWEEKILIADDAEPIRILMSALLNEDGIVDTANNGQEALEKLRNTYYKVIISDVDMPTMDGIAFYQEALQLFPAISKRFLFFSGTATPEQISFITEQGVRFIWKPASIKEIHQRVLALLLDPSL